MVEAQAQVAGLALGQHCSGGGQFLVKTIPQASDAVVIGQGSAAERLPRPHDQTVNIARIHFRHLTDKRTGAND